MPPELAVATLREVRALASQVGERLVALDAAGRTGHDKGGVDVVTAADTLSESLLAEGLHGLFPGHRIICEEGLRLGPADSPWTWHVDPLDGTGNFSRDLPYWAISLGLAHGDEPVLGLVHGPACGVTVYAAVGVGAWGGAQPADHDRPLAPAAPAGDPRTWMVASDWPWDLAERQRTCTLLSRLAPRIRQYKTYGSAAIDLAHLALGRIDAYAVSKLFTWDQAGGAAVAAALGYELRRWDGSRWDLRHADLVACRPGMWPLLGEATAP